MSTPNRAELPKPPRVAVDPEIPERDRLFILENNPKDRDDEPPLRPLPIRISPGLLAELLMTRVGRRTAIIGVAATALLLLLLGRPDLALTVGLVMSLGYVLLIALSGLKIGEYNSERTWRVHHDRYIAIGELDKPARELLARAQRAIDVVLDSDVNRAGLLDSVHNQVALPYQEWEIANTLRNLTQLRQRYPELAQKTSNTPGRDALKQSVQANIQRVEALENYADHVRAADTAYILVNSIGERHVVAQIGDLTTQARATEQTLQENVQQALQAAAVLDNSA
jgi:hypothetical protein